MRAMLLTVLLLASGCGLIFGDSEHWFPGPVTRMAASFVTGLAVAYGWHRYWKHERRESRRDQRGPEPKA